MLMHSSIKQWYLVHKWTSLICTAFMLLLCLTGLPLIFADEIDRALGYSMAPPDLPETAERADLDTIISAAKARRPGDAVQFIVTDPDEPDLWFVRMAESVAAAKPSAFYAFPGSRYFCESFYGHPCPTSGKSYATANACGCPSRPASFVGYPARGIQHHSRNDLMRCRKACIFTTQKALRENTCAIASGDYSTPVSQRTPAPAIICISIRWTRAS